MGPGRTVHRLDTRGTVRDWLVSPAWSEPVYDLATHLDATGTPWGGDGRWVLTNGPDATPLKQALYRSRPLREDLPPEPVTEGGPVSYLGPTGRLHQGTWQRVHTGSDGLVDWSAFCFTPQYRLAVAATAVEVDQAERCVLRLASTGPTRIFQDGRLIGESAAISYMEPVEQRIAVWLPSRITTFVVASWQVAFRECRQVLRLRMDGLPVRVVIASPGADEYASASAEEVLDAVGTARWGVTEPVVALTGPPGARLRVWWTGGPAYPTRVRLTAGQAELRLIRARPDPPDAPEPVLPRGRVTTPAVGVAATPTGDAGPVPLAVPAAPPARQAGPVGESGEPTEDVGSGELAEDVGSASMLVTSGVLRVAVDDDRTPVERYFPVAVLPADHRAEPVGEPAGWRREVLEHAAASGAAVAGELARFAVTGAGVTAAGLATALDMLGDRADCADFEAVGLLYLWHRVPAPDWSDGLRKRVREALLGFKYWIDQPGLDTMCYFTENHQLVWHTAETLAGEAFPDEVFTNTGWPGTRHAAHGGRLARDWISRRLAGGFSEFDSNAYLAIDILALVALVECTGDAELAGLAAGLTDRVLFSLAANSWRGVHAAAHGRAYVPALRSARLAETSPIMRLCFGVGALNDALLPATALATARRYAVPDAIRATAGHVCDTWWGRQSYRGVHRFTHDLLDRPYGSDAVVYRTPEVMLASVQDYRVGLPGLQEHVWGATLGPEARIFATHPPNSSCSPSSRPNAWAGNRILPRVRQSLDTLLALYHLPSGDPMGRTHAWFPVAHLDEWAQRGSWTAGRVGDGYVALATDGGATLARSGPDAWQELYPAGRGAAWVCTVGRRAVHGTFQEFLASLAEPDFTADRVAVALPGGHLLELPWTGPFTVDGQPADLDGDGRPLAWPQVDNPACRLAHGATEMLIQIDGAQHRIDLRRGRPLPPADPH
jgi:hypothetical protein